MKWAFQTPLPTWWTPARSDPGPTQPQMPRHYTPEQHKTNNNKMRWWNWLFLFSEGKRDQKTTFNCIYSPEPGVFGRQDGCTKGYHRTRVLRLETPDLTTSLGCCPKAAQAWQSFWGSPAPHPLPPLHSRGDWDLRDRKLFGPQSYFRYFLWERKWKLIQEQGFTKEAICLLDYLFACQSLSYGTG